MNYDYFILDVFTDTPFGGNQLAVFPHAEGIPEPLMQKIAREFNFSETTFVFPPDKKENDIKLRIFTPAVEVPTAGHPTIGTAHILLNEGILAPATGKAVFEEGIGEIIISFDYANGSYRNIGMTQPLPVFGSILKNTDLLSSILGLPVEEIDQRYPVQAVSCGNNFLFVPLKSLEGMSKIKLRTDLLENYRNELNSTEIYVFTTDTVSPDATTHGRMFAPMFGIQEDPATGSASGPLGCYLVKYGISDGQAITCEQGYEMGRPSIIKVKIDNDGGEIRGVKVSGNAVKIAQGRIFI
jgi:trans-2,3-dihydro-3-hydroxyanthranilate isomerase